MLNTSILFEIIAKNMFNRKNLTTYVNNGKMIYEIDSYIQSVRWNDFISNPQLYIDAAYTKSLIRGEYNLTRYLS